MKMEPLSSYGSTRAMPNTSEQILNLIAEFKGDNRRQASDQLVAMYPQNKTAVVEGLINAILDSGPDTYRVNLYIARTLGKISPNWEGTYDQFQKLSALSETPNYEDKTFRDWVVQALSRYVSNAAIDQPSPKLSPSPSPSPRRPRPRRAPTKPLETSKQSPAVAYLFRISILGLNQCQVET